MRGAASALARARSAPLTGPVMVVALTLAAAVPVSGAGEAHVPPDSLASWSGVILDHVQRYPGMEPVDLYKLLHQGALGAEHAVPDAEAARSWLQQEIASLGAAPPGERLVEGIAPGGVHVRVHLRPFLAAAGDAEALLQAFLETAGRGAGAGAGAGAGLEAALEAALELAAGGELPWSPATLSALFSDLAAQGYPARHHSDEYRRLYAPAYRVISGDLVEGLLASARLARAAPRRSRCSTSTCYRPLALPPLPAPRCPERARYPSTTMGRLAMAGSRPGRSRRRWSV